MLIAGKFLMLKDKGRQGNVSTYLVEDNVTGERAYLKLHLGECPGAMQYITGMNVLKDSGVRGLLTHMEAGLLEEEQGCYMLFPEVTGPTLEGYLSMAAPFDEREALRLAEELLETLNGMHQEGYAHLFVNTRNVFYSPGKKVLIKDPAMTAELYEAMVEGMESLEYSYMSPELMDGQEASPEDDLYALGKMMEDIASRVEWSSEKNRKEYLEKAKAMILAPSGHGEAHESEEVCREEAGESSAEESDKGEAGALLPESIGNAFEEGLADAMETDLPLVGQGGIASQGVQGESERIWHEFDDSAEPFKGAENGIQEDSADHAYASAGWKGISLDSVSESLVLESPAEERPVLRVALGAKWAVLIAAVVLFVAAGALAILRLASDEKGSGDRIESSVLLGADGRTEGNEEEDGGAAWLVMEESDLQGSGTGIAGEGQEDVGGTPDSGIFTSEKADAPIPAGDRTGDGANGQPAANREPKACFSITPLEGPSPLRVLLDASGSSDPDGHIVSYQWSCGGSGVSIYRVFESSVIPSKVGITLTVTDDRGASASITRYITLY